MGGIFGVVRKSDCVADLFYGTDYLSHLGTKRGGMAVSGPTGFKWKIHKLESNYFRTQLEPNLPELSGNIGIGSISDTDAQPLPFTSHLGRFCIASVARISNSHELTAKAVENGCCFSGASDGKGVIRPTEIVAMLLSAEKSFEDGIRAVHEKIQGSCTFVIMTPKGLYACRDKLGRTPLILGKKEDGFAVSSESSAFQNLGYETLRDLGPGEAVFITPEGCETRVAPGRTMQICTFLWVYYGYPSSTYEGVNVEAFRYRCGALLGVNDDVEADIVSGIPDSGIGHAVGYANSKGLPYQRPIVKYTPTWPRSFMPQNQLSRDLVARMKLIPNRALIEGQRIIFLDDSIVRGTQLKDNARVLFEYGAKAAHMRIACPPLLYPCDYLNFSSARTELELIALKAVQAIEGNQIRNLNSYAETGNARQVELIEWVRRELKLTSLRFQTLDNLVKAVGLPKERLCTHCWDGSGFCTL
ncbi:amidophosphoribosyltransferase [Desulfovibrio sp. OttesenSCG-928-M16]|nr:amidophosphoribosyltransferase [Desulfovibrio sp. OttesenSCG-928-M16]